jgi:hypothetical protein
MAIWPRSRKGVPSARGGHGDSAPYDHTRGRRAHFLLPAAEGQLLYPNDLLVEGGNGAADAQQAAGPEAPSAVPPRSEDDPDE